MRFLAIAAVALSFTACATTSKPEKTVTEVMSTQSKILGRIVANRSQPDFKAHIQSDPVIAAQEVELLDGLSGLLASQKALIDAQNAKSGGNNGQ